MHGWAPEVIGAVGQPEPNPEPTTWQTRQAQYDAISAWGIPNHALLERVTYPDSAHGSLFRHHAEFAADVHAFLDEAD